MSLKSYDRLFPNQDTLPKGRFGNLIALPLQKRPCENERSAFVDADLRPHVDRWAYLASVRPIEAHDIEPALLRATGGVHRLDVTFVDDEDLATPWRRHASVTNKPRVIGCAENFQQHIKQRQERLRAFLGIDRGAVGTVGGGKAAPTGMIDIAPMQSLSRRGHVDPLVERNGHVFVDECHHVGAVSFDAILKRVKAKYVLGATATPLRRDGQQPIVFMWCRPIRHTAAWPPGAPRDLEAVARVRHTRIDLAPDAGIREVSRHLASDRPRTEATAPEVESAIGQGRKISGFDGVHRPS